jgi:hypothetical protein
MYKITERDIRECDWYTRRVMGRWEKRADEDDIQTGREAMCYAAQDFEFERGFRLLTYAKHYVHKQLFVKHFNSYNGRATPVKGCMFRGGIKKPELFLDRYQKIDNEKVIIDRITAKQVLAEMPPELAGAIVSKLMDGKLYQDTAKEIGISGAALDQRLHKWRKRNKTLVD